IFVRDTLLGTTERVSVDSTGAQSNGSSSFPSLSRSGRFVAFESDATNLAAGASNGVLQVYIHDRVTGQTVRASVDENGASGDADSHTFNGAPHISDDGRFIAFDGYSSNLVPGDTNATGDVFVRDLEDPCRAGNVNAGVGPPFDALLVSGGI